MKFKTESLEDEYISRPRRLREICEKFDELSKKHKITATVTRVLERIDGSSGVHEAGRGVDFRNEVIAKNGSVFLYDSKTSKTIVDELNTLYPRTDGKKVCIHHSFNGGAYHFHIQIPVSWIEKGDKC